MTYSRSDTARTAWLLTASIDELQHKLSKSELTSRQLVLLYLERIAELDRGEHGIRSIIEINPDAIGIADAMDALRLRDDRGRRRYFFGSRILGLWRGLA